LNEDEDSPDSAEYARRAADILNMFSLGDPIVRSQFARLEVLQGLMQRMATLPQPVLLPILRV
jgi:hypothetical protein